MQLPVLSWIFFVGGIPVVLIHCTIVNQSIKLAHCSDKIPIYLILRINFHPRLGSETPSSSMLRCPLLYYWFINLLEHAK